MAAEESLPRTLLLPSAFRVSRPGVDVTKPPSTTPRDLSFNSDWLNVERVPAAAFIRKSNLGKGRSIKIGETLPAPPFAVLLRQDVNDPSTVYDSLLHDDEFRFGPGQDVIKMLSETYIVDYTTRSTVFVKQQPAKRLSGTGTATTDHYSSTPFNFTMLMFRRDRD